MTWRRGGGRLSVLLFVAGLSACAGSGGGNGGGGGQRGCKPPATPTVSFANNIQPIFNASCAVGGCHEGSVRAGGLNLSLGAAYGEIVGQRAIESRQQRIARGKPDDSFLIQKIEYPPGTPGLLMPQGCPANPLNGARCLSADQIASIRQWVTECAPQN